MCFNFLVQLIYAADADQSRDSFGTPITLHPVADTHQQVTPLLTRIKTTASTLPALAFSLTLPKKDRTPWRFWHSLSSEQQEAFLLLTPENVKAIQYYRNLPDIPFNAALTEYQRESLDTIHCSVGF